MLPTLLVFAAALLGPSHSANINKHMRQLGDLNNNVEHNSLPAKLLARKEFNVVLKPGPLIAHAPGTTLEIVCEAFGSPAPSIHWYKNDAPVFEHDLESAEMIDTNPSSMARLESKLLVTKTEAEDRYLCLAKSGGKVASATTTVYQLDAGGSSTELTERLKLRPLSPHILVYYSTYVDIIGNNVVLPCHSRGHPKPHIAWTHRGNGQPNETVVKNGPRLKVLRSGELVISPLRWDDMGEFTCYATNTFGTERRVTFVYPAKAG